MLKEIRSAFLEFFKQKDHKIIDSSSIIPKSDPTILFINSGMAPLKKFFLQEETPPSTMLTNSQRCLRVGGKHNDLSEVGYTKRHHTFFEMLGNFSFGAYFQKQAIEFAWEFLTKQLKIDPKRLWVTVHPEDDSALEIWQKTAPELGERISKLKENIWSMGEVGPFGFCSEIFYDHGPSEEGVPPGQGDEGSRYMEIWNLVFMRWFTDGKIKSDLSAPCIDTGIGLERLVAVMEGVTDTYETSVFKNLLPILGLEKHTVNSRIFLDHLRAIAVMVTEGILPGSGKREYVLRCLMRRALRSFSEMNLDFESVTPKLISAWMPLYNFWDEKKIYKIFKAEKDQFDSVLKNGMKILSDIYKKTKAISAEDLFLLHDTYGFPVDISEDFVKANGGSVDKLGFEKLMQEHKVRSRKDSSFKSKILYPRTHFINQPEINTEILDFEKKGEDTWLIFSHSPFYAEGGGQIGDIGIIESKSLHAEIIDTQEAGGVYMHKAKILAGEIKKNDLIKAKVDWERRKQITAHHSATHLLHSALNQVLGGHIKQMGSLVAQNKLRFDISHGDAISNKQISKIEELLNSWVMQNLSVKIEEMSYKEALKMGAKAFFEDAYGDVVRTVKMGECSFELCGGTHVEATGQIGFFKINKVQSISAGNKRIEAIVADSAFQTIQEQLNLLKMISDKMKAPHDQIIQKLEGLLNKKEVKNAFDLQKKTIQGMKLGYGMVPEALKIGDIEKYMKQAQIDAACVAFMENEKLKVMLKLNNLEFLDARVIIRELAKVVGAKGSGGRKDFAETAGPNCNKERVFEKLFETIIA